MAVTSHVGLVCAVLFCFFAWIGALTWYIATVPLYFTPQQSGRLGFIGFILDLPTLIFNVFIFYVFPLFLVFGIGVNLVMWSLKAIGKVFRRTHPPQF
jgi:hypothetical protein